MNNYDIITVDHISLLKYNDNDFNPILEKRMSDLKMDLLITIYNVDILIINKYVEIYKSYPPFPYTNIEKYRKRLKTISRSLKINKILKNDFNV